MRKQFKHTFKCEWFWQGIVKVSCKNNLIQTAWYPDAKGRRELLLAGGRGGSTPQPTGRFTAPVSTAQPRQDSRTQIPIITALEALSTAHSKHSVAQTGLTLWTDWTEICISIQLFPLSTEIREKPRPPRDKIQLPWLQCLCSLIMMIFTRSNCTSFKFCF